MKPSVEQIQNLLALKRHEAPEEGYMEDFLVEFHRRRRQEAVRTTGLAANWQRFSDWFSNIGTSQKIYAGGLAYATILAALLLAPRENPEQAQPSVPVRNEVVPAKEKPVQQLEELDLSPASKGHTGEQEF